ncbi:MAG: Asp23/Gls24 family envelope stress response protein [Solobacterium sp.]|nr:Asp23/Gls24 family envelope stress response protein [Solobacterium sp.]
MAQDYVKLNEDEGNGMIAINKSVFQAIAEISVEEIENAVALPATKFSRPLQVKIENNHLHFEVDLNIRYGANVQQTCELVQNKIYENVLFMTGFKTTETKVNVRGFEI